MGRRSNRRKGKAKAKKPPRVTTKEEREAWANKIKIELAMYNFGLPPDDDYKDMDWVSAIKRFQALHELYVRLNLYVTTNEKSHGHIEFPEAKRNIEYFFDSSSTKNNKVNLNATTKNYFIKQRQGQTYG